MARTRRRTRGLWTAFACLALLAGLTTSGPDLVRAAVQQLRVPYRIGYLERDAWLRCMHTAVAEIDAQTLDDAHRRELLDYLVMAADAMVNAPF